MTCPRQILPGCTYLITRRCNLRQFLLRPDSTVRRLLEYCLAEAAEVFGIQLHAYCFMSNHYHVVLTDPKGNLPEFQHRFNRHASACINAYRNRSGATWEAGSYNAVKLLDGESIVEKIVYTLANPVKAGLVHTSKKWPGLHSRPGDCGQACRIKRPKAFFPESGTMPKEVTLTLHRPPPFEDQDDEEWSQYVEEHLKMREREIRAEFRDTSRDFLGHMRVLGQSPFDFPATSEPQNKDASSIKPRVASRVKAIRIAALKLLQAFVKEYRQALMRYRNGCRTVVFPAGTYKMRWLFRVRCEPVPLSP